ncbi:TonB-dependent receptor [Sphingopyxis sp. J-6]|uniref:TonB-dependent receptor domain-containing protein n=1 Tax=Sphingopyxis sp. J-6 TaxID=3122054 RepID=UPI0039845D33
MSIAALIASSAPAFAQDAPAGEQAADDASIVVTGTRVNRSGFTAPTPETVLGEAELEGRAPANIANVVNDLPQLTPTLNPSTSGVGVGGGTGGANLLNLRGLGINRTLVLLNGSRVVPSTTTGGVDVNLLPQGLVKRVDVVTGGASAAWGSDAVAGVINFVLDTEFEGLKLNLSAGSAFEGDAHTYNGNITFGKSFAGGRGHLLVDLSGAIQGGVDNFTDRDWYDGSKVVNNPTYTPTNGQPRQIVSTGDFLVASDGGVIISGPRALNTAFAPDGTPFAYNPGTPTSPYKIGGTPNDIGAGYPLVVPVKYGSAFARLSYDVLDGVTAYVEGSYSKSRTVNDTASYVSLGNVVIAPDNAYLPEGFTGAPFVLGKVFTSLGTPYPRNDRSVTRIVGGLDGRFGDSWKWAAYYQYGKSHVLNEVSNNPIVPNVVLATDAVFNTAGQIVCRSTLTNPTNGCVPFNPFGTALASDAASAYATGTAAQHIVLKEEVASATITGEPFSLWAGPISLAVGAEYRTESYTADADPLSISSSYWVGNYKPGRGKYSVKEAFAELVVPIVRDVPLFKAFDLNLAGRITDYSTSGTVKTYKLGGTWDVIDGVRIRGTHSRDIRAPNLNDLFLGGQANTLIVVDPQNANAQYGVVQVLQGNPDLMPEIANTNTIGLVLQPSFVPGLSFSVDYYDTKIKGAITTLSGQQIVDNCAAGQAGFCPSVIRDSAGLITRVNVSGFNANVEKVRGIDYELSYSRALSDLGIDIPGRVNLRVLASNTRERTITALGGTIDYLGMVGTLGAGAPPKWRWLNSLSYDSDAMRTQLTMRRVGAGVLDNRNIECTSACPTSTAANPTIDNNKIKGVTYFDLSQTFKIRPGGKEAEFYVAVENLLDRDPPRVALASFLAPGASGVFHDLIGRRFRVGFRFEY